MSIPTTGVKRTDTPSVEDLYKRKFITKSQRDAYVSKNQEALTKANDEAFAKGIKKSNQEKMPTSTRRTTSTTTNTVSNSRNAIPVSQNTQKRRATASLTDRASTTFDSIKTTMENRGFVRIQPFEVMNSNGESAILTFLKSVAENTSGNHTVALNKYQEVLNKVSKSKKDNDEPELFDIQGADEYEEMLSILKSLKRNNSNLGDLRIVLQWVKDDGTLASETLGTGKQEVHLVNTPDKKFEAFFKNPSRRQ
jgi:hypothetical protein